MKQSLSNLRTILTVVALTLAAGAAANRANASEWNKRTILTVNETVQVKDTVLQPGQYVLQLLNSDSDRHIVEIFNGDQSHLISTVFAIPKQRMQATGDSQFTFWETPPGTAKALRAWFYPGDTFGQEFPYPKNPYLVAMAESPAIPALTTPPAPEPSADVTEPAPSASTTPEPAAEEPTPETTPADATTPDMTPAPEAAPATDPTPSSAEPEPPPEQAPPEALPKTGSRYPLLGISGAALLAIGTLLSFRRLA